MRVCSSGAGAVLRAVLTYFMGPGGSSQRASQNLICFSMWGCAFLSMKRCAFLRFEDLHFRCESCLRGCFYLSHGDTGGGDQGAKLLFFLSRDLVKD